MNENTNENRPRPAGFQGTNSYLRRAEIKKVLVENDGSQNDGSQNDGSQNDGSQNDGSQNDGSQNDGSQNDGSQNDGSQLVEGVLVDPKPYDRREDEPLKWFARFQHFLLLGHSRTVNDVYRSEAAAGNLKGQQWPAKATQGQEIHVPGSWKAAVNRWEWHKRADAYDREQLEAEKKQIETDRVKRRQAVIDQEWDDSELMLSTARGSLKHGHKFFQRTTHLKKGQFVKTTEVNPRTGKEVEVRTRVDREIVYIEHKLGDVSRMLMEGAKKARQAVNMTTPKVQEEFFNQTTAEVMDNDAVDQHIYQMFENLGANNCRPPALTEDEGEEPDEDEGEDDSEPDDELPGDVSEGDAE